MRAFAFPLFLFLAACAGPIETRVDSAGASGATPASFNIDKDAAGLIAGVQAKAVKALTDKGYSLADNGELNLQTTVSDKPASLAVKTETELRSSVVDKTRCATREYRVAIILTKIADGSEYYRGYASEFHCKLTIEEALPSLVSAALADIGAPRGRYVVKRSRSR
jgi:hypothetical protein